MKNISDYIMEASVPEFVNDKNGIEAFCKYVFNPNFVNWTVTNDLTIKVDNKKSSSTIGLDAGDLKKIPDFIKIVSTNRINIFGDKLESLALKGSTAGLYVTDLKKLNNIDLSGLQLINSNDTRLHIEKNPKLIEIIGPSADNCNIIIRINKALKKIDMSNIKKFGKTNWINKNRMCDIKRADLPRGKEQDSFINLQDNGANSITEI